jgi:hypothetical protein
MPVCGDSIEAVLRSLPVDVKEKRVCVIRHAKSEAQSSSREERRKSLHLLDAKLQSDQMLLMKGFGAQVIEDEALNAVDIVLCSPLTRAIQTACLTFESLPVKILLVPELTEFPVHGGMSGYENMGRPWDKIIQDKLIRALPKFEDIDFSLIRDFEANFGSAWWVKAFDSMRNATMIRRLKKFLLSLPFKRIAIVGHCCNLMALLNTRLRVPNATPIWCRLSVSGQEISLVRTDLRTMGQLEAATKRKVKVHVKNQSKAWASARDLGNVKLEDISTEDEILRQPSFRGRVGPAQVAPAPASPQQGVSHRLSKVKMPASLGGSRNSVLIGPAIESPASPTTH